MSLEYRPIVTIQDNLLILDLPGWESLSKKTLYESLAAFDQDKHNSADEFGQSLRDWVDFLFSAKLIEICEWRVVTRVKGYPVILSRLQLDGDIILLTTKEAHRHEDLFKLHQHATELLVRKWKSSTQKMCLRASVLSNRFGLLRTVAQLWGVLSSLTGVIGGNNSLILSAIASFILMVVFSFLDTRFNVLEVV